MSASIEVGILCQECSERVYPDDDGEYVCSDCDRKAARVEDGTIHVLEQVTLTPPTEDSI